MSSNFDQITSGAAKAIARSRELLERTMALPGMRAKQIALTPAQRTDRYAKPARESVLEPATDGLQSFTAPAEDREAAGMNGTAESAARI
jgi:hypothetical protein